MAAEDADHGDDEWKEANDERVLHERGTDRRPDVHVALAFEVRGDRIGELRQIRPDRYEADADQEGRSAERRRKRPRVVDCTA
jgi:hypothetical protein